MAGNQGGAVRTPRDADGAAGPVDYHAVFAVLTAPKAVLSPDLTVLDANESLLRTIDVPASAVVGRHYLDVFPAHGPDGSSVERVVRSLERVARTGRLEMIGPHRYDLRRPDGRWAERWWITTNLPVLDAGGRVSAVVHRAEDVTSVVLARGPAAPDTGRGEVSDCPDAMSLVDRALLLGSSVDRYAEVITRERSASLAIQDSILTPPPDIPGLAIDVRYRPAVPEVHVGGDWYDAFVHPDGETTVVVGDVTGHDVAAAAHMGHLRGVLRSVAFATDAGPATALDAAEQTAEGLGLQALATVAVARIGAPGPAGRRAVRWASAGHLPPVVRRADGTAHLLTARPSPMLGVGLGGPRTEHEASLDPGDTLLLYTDGLVERRDRSLREVLDELPGRVEGLGDVAPEELLDALLAELVPHGAQDDVALVMVHVDDGEPSTGPDV
ncbi:MULTISPECIES: PP2C family protein-serine/threonine phosphatase [Cellulosimicrobium]|uniref:SpoIIE family protein phosphatase n=1 Tax=Cellulosimicrobium sp. ES-005 TaxID=3163031 RepID=A0AAU8G8B2_9MICO|nr:SpoIIE family protein phosphatase [Cellulosimicrobium cellulans]MCO7271589.1 SpoIIE family protein phosphatase [Cellulosimicrobium cellulans]